MRVLQPGTAAHPHRFATMRRLNAVNFGPVLKVGGCRVLNPNGIPTSSPGLRGTSYPGNNGEDRINPNGNLCKSILNGLEAKGSDYHAT